MQHHRCLTQKYWICAGIKYTVISNMEGDEDVATWSNDYIFSHA